MMALARGLPSRAFYVGDPGVKLIAARNAIAHPARPFEIPLPQVGGEPVARVDPFFIVHGGHSHAVTSELFPLLSAPFIAMLGLRGAYILPAAGLLLALAATAWLAVLLDPRRSAATVVLTAFLGTPLLFYGLEFWEHALAAGVAGLATALFVRTAVVGPSFSSGVTDGTSPELKFGPTFASGFLFGIGALLRPEALWFAVAVLVGSRFSSPRPPLAAVVLAVAGIAAAFVPLELYTLIHFGSLVPPHIAGNPAIVSGDWIAMRSAIVSSWFLSGGISSFWRVAPAVLLAPVAVAIAIAAPAAMPSRGTENPRRGISESSRRGWGPGASEKSRAFLFTIAFVNIVLVMLTAPNDGGGQWGPRYLLLAYGPLSILAADTISYVVSAFRRTGDGALPVGSDFRRIVSIALVAFLALGGGWIQRAAYKQLRGSKLMYDRVVDFVAREVPPGGYAVTDLWWLDQVAAAVTADRTMLFAPDADSAVDSIGRLDRARLSSVTVIRSRDESPELSASIYGTCYQEEGRQDIPERTLVAIRLRRRCP